MKNGKVKLMERNFNFENSRQFALAGRLVVKTVGSVDDIQKHIEVLKKIYGNNRINCSPILKNKDGSGFFCFINILSESGQE